MKIFNLPDLGEGLPDAEIHEWHVKEGESVKAGDPLVSVETAKAIVDIPAPYEGRIVKLYGQQADIIKTGSALVGFEADDARQDNGTVVGHLETGGELLEDVVDTPLVTTASPKAIPAARILAKKLGIDLQDIPATGAQGQITLVDVQQAAQASSRLLGDWEALKGPRRMMAIAMANSHAEVVPVTLVDEVDIHHFPVNSDMTVKIIRALIAASKEEPVLNAWFDGKTLSRYLFTDVNIGMAMDTQEGLFVPVIRAAQNLTDIELRQTINSFKDQVKTRTIASDHLKGSTIVLSNFGTLAGRYATPVLVPPAVAILGVGRMYEAVVPFDGKPAIRRVLPLSLTCDHRAVTGGEAARFLAVIIRSFT